MRNSTLIILDRDGTLIREVNFLGKHDNWKEEVVLNTKVIRFLKGLDKLLKDNIKIVVSNQAGVARGFFSEEKVMKINDYINKQLKDEGIIISKWKYCPNVDKEYAEKTKYKFIKKYVLNKTKRKPSVALVNEALKELGVSLKDFNKILVIGDRKEDRGLAENLNATFVDVNNL